MRVSYTTHRGYKMVGVAGDDPANSLFYEKRAVPT